MLRIFLQKEDEWWKNPSENSGAETAQALTLKKKTELNKDKTKQKT